MTKVPKMLSLKEFMLRQEVLKLYREIFRTIRQVPDKSSQQELREWARHDFNINRHKTDEMAIKMSILHGRRCLGELQSSLGMSGLQKEQRSEAADKK